APAIKKLLAQTGLTLEQMDVIELNEAFAAQALACTRDLGIEDGSEKVNPNGGAIALGHPLGASGARLVTTALNQLEQTGGQYALCSMCIGVDQGIALIIERVEILNALSSLLSQRRDRGMIKDLKKMPSFTSNDAQINYQTFGDASKPALVFSKSLC